MWKFISGISLGIGIKTIYDYNHHKKLQEIILCQDNVIKIYETINEYSNFIIYKQNEIIDDYKNLK